MMIRTLQGQGGEVTMLNKQGGPHWEDGDFRKDLKEVREQTEESEGRVPDRHQQVQRPQVQGRLGGHEEHSDSQSNWRGRSKGGQVKSGRDGCPSGRP